MSNLPRFAGVFFHPRLILNQHTETPKPTSGPGSGRGGARPGAGRPKGSRTRATLANIAKARSGGVLPHEFLLEVVRGKKTFEDQIVTEDGHVLKVKRKPTFTERVDAAKAVAPYYAPRLAQVEGKSTVTHGISDELKALVQEIHAAGAGRLPYSKPRLVVGSDVVDVDTDVDTRKAKA